MKHSTKEIGEKLAKCLIEKLHAMAKAKLSANKDRAEDIANKVIGSNDKERSDDGGVESATAVVSKPL